MTIFSDALRKIAAIDYRTGRMGSNMDLYVGTSSTDADFLEKVADHIEAQGVHPVRIELDRGAYNSSLRVECQPHEVAETAAHFSSFKPLDE